MMNRFAIRYALIATEDELCALMDYHDAAARAAHEEGDTAKATHHTNRLTELDALEAEQ